MSYKPLEVGQTVWIEETSIFIPRERDITEYEIVEANGSSAYAVHVHDLQDVNPSRYRIDQRTRKVKLGVVTFTAYRVWETPEVFSEDVEKEVETNLMRHKAMQKVKNMDYEQLKAFHSD